jgi:hypothetical protein
MSQLREARGGDESNVPGTYYCNCHKKEE